MPDRRDFIKHALAGTGALLTWQPILPANPLRGDAPPTSGLFCPLGQPVRSATDRVRLGRTGIVVSYLAQGTGTYGSARSSDQVRLGARQFDKLLRHALDSGINLIDLADSYGSHRPAAQVLRGLPRDRYVIQTKIWPRLERWNRPSGGALAEIDRFRRELKVERIDICLIHAISDLRWVESCSRIRDDLSALKEEGVVGAIGISCHSHGVLKAAIDDPWVDVISARINYPGGRDLAMDDSVGAVAATLLRAREAGKAVIGMKVFGAGRLTSPQARNDSLRYILENRLVDAVSIGMMSPGQIDDVVSRIGAVGLG